MRVHANAPLSPKGRLALCRRVEEQGWTLRAAAEAAGLSVRSAGKWLARYRCEGAAGLSDRPSTPRSIPHRTPEDRVEAIACLRRLRMTGAEIAECLGMALSTVSAVLARIGLGKLSRLEPPEPPNRYERSRAGELVHIDVKKLGRILAAGHRVTSSRASQKKTRRERKRVGLAGWEYVHVCVDDATPPGLRRGPTRRTSHHGDRLPQTSARLLSGARHPSRASHDRQRLGLPLHHPRDRLPRTRDPPPAHTPLPATHQRKGRKIHPHHARRLGLRSRLRNLGRTHRRATRLARVL
jgi:transposase